MKIKVKKIMKWCGIFFFSIIILFVLSICILKKIFYPLTHFEIVKSEASKNGIDPYLVMAIIKTESGFNNEATSKKEAKGLMQIMDTTASDINSEINVVDDVNENLYDENVNIALGCKYFSNLVNKYNGNYYIAICAYNAGMGNVDKWIEQGFMDKNLSNYKDISLPFKETENYLKKVIVRYKMYRVLYR